jgi:hypothetical protein
MGGLAVHDDEQVRTWRFLVALAVVLAAVLALARLLLD